MRSRLTLRSMRGSSKLGSLIAFGLSIGIIALAGWIFLNRQAILDQFAVWSYQPTPAIVTIANNIQFTDKGRQTFYATKPSIDGRDAFNQACPRQEEASAILGCYTGADRIFIYDVTNVQLNGIEEVTAAHETLHAVWHRKSKAEQDTLSAQLQATYDKLDDPTLKERMAYYQRTEPGEFTNELHSILGTEVPNLGDSLEAYYNQFFSRSAVLAQHAQYQAVYAKLSQQSKDLYDKMQALSKTIEANSATYKTAAERLSADIQSFNTRAQNGSFSNRNEFNAERASLLARTTALDSQRASINANIQTYNGYYEQYQNLSKQIETLNQSIDSYSEITKGPSI